MALQDVCRLHNPPVFPEWNTPLSQSSTSEYTTYPARQGCFGDTLCPRLSGRSNISPLEFYIPVAEYLTECPVNFGQPGFSSQPAKLLTVDHLHPSLPSISLPTPTPCSVSPSVPLPFTLSHGTTTLGFAFQGGVIAAADTRSSCSGLVACPLAPKVLPIHSHLVGTTSGTSADCALWKRILARELRLYQLRHNHRLSTGGAAKLLSHMLHPFKGTELCVAVTLCGWDGDAKAVEAQSVNTTKAKRDGGICGPRVVYVCSDGLRLQGELFSVGSGSPYAYSILDRSIHWDMSVLEATAVAREAVYRATYRDAYSGNNVDLYHVTAEGWRRREREDLKEEYYRERKMEGEKMAKRAGEKDNKTKVE